MLIPPPTAAHQLADTHDTPPRPDPETKGVGCIVQLVPSQPSTSPDPLFDPAGRKSPTAAQAVGDTHDTSTTLPLAAIGELASDQEVPSQISTSGPSVLAPTATHDEEDVHDTAWRMPFDAPAGSGIVCIVQLLPSHRSVNPKNCRLLL
jgi:hypothetical protein